MQNNQAVVCRIGNFQPIEGADRIIKASVILNGVSITQVVVGKNDYTEGDLVIYFDSNLCIEDSVILAIDKQHENYNKENFVSIARYLAKGNRVKTVKLKSEISDGLVVDVSKFYTFFKNEKEAIKTLVENFSFNDLNSTHICRKYFPPVKQLPTVGNKKNKRKKKLISRVIPEMWNFHVETLQILKNLHMLKPNQIINISAKWHGCVSWDTIVETLEYGKMQIKKIVDNKINCHIKSFDTSTKEIVYANVDAFYKKENDGDWYEIELENGKKIKITGNNPVWLPNLNCYRKAEELTINDFVLID